jgi:nucleoside-triphosphatase THEP1
MRRLKKQVPYFFCELNPQILIVHGPIGSGKTNRAEQITDRAKVNGYKVYGVISRRVMRGRKTIGYDAFFPQTMETTPMVYRDTEVSGDNWQPLRGPFLYNEYAFQQANDALIEAAYLMDEKTLVVVDEFGHLEARGFGLYMGLIKVVEALQGGGRLLILCRTDKIDNVLCLFHNEAKILVLESNRKDFWDSLGDSFI